MTWVDWLVVLMYLIVVVGVGWAVRSGVGRSVKGFFLAGRKMPWWVVGMSMVATTYSSDTPLAITGIIAKWGLAGNWLWWCWALAYVLLAVVFARWWWRLGVLTDAEFVRVRYGESVMCDLLRMFRGLYLGVVLNVVVLGWVFLAMNRILLVLLPWEEWRQADWFSAVLGAIPSWAVIGSPEGTVAIVLSVALVVLYCGWGGLRGVMLTDVFQFVISIGVAILLAIRAVEAVGGWDVLSSVIHSRYEWALELFPGEGTFPVKDFLICVMVLWWAQYFSDGTGYLAQRVNASRSEKDAEWGTLLFVVLNFWVRTLPWVVVALAALVLFPPEEKLPDRELTYPLVMKQMFGKGELGLGLAAFLAAFMSTVDTHLNWGASYLVNDVVGVVANRQGIILSEKQKVRLGRVCILLLGLLAVIASTQMKSIVGAWKLFFVIGAGMGMVQIVRWFAWWVTPAGELLAMSTSLVAGVVAVVAGFEELEAVVVGAGAGAGGLALSVWLAIRKESQWKEQFYRFVERRGPASPSLLVRWLGVSVVVLGVLLLLVSQF